MCARPAVNYSRRVVHSFIFAHLTEVILEGCSPHNEKCRIHVYFLNITSPMYALRDSHGVRIWAPCWAATATNVHIADNARTIITQMWRACKRGHFSLYSHCANFLSQMQARRSHMKDTAPTHPLQVCSNISVVGFVAFQSMSRRLCYIWYVS